MMLIFNSKTIFYILKLITSILYLFVAGVVIASTSASVTYSYNYPKPIIKKVIVVGGTHGNEYTGVWCIKSIDTNKHIYKDLYPSLDISTLLANPKAHLENKRFIHTDLNREFSDDKLLKQSQQNNIVDLPVGEEGMANTIESLRAKEVNEILGPKFNNGPNTDLVIDLHSTTSNMGVTLIIPENDPIMGQAAAYVIAKCGGEEQGFRILMHSMPSKSKRPNLSSVAKHGFTIEVGPVPQGLLRHDAVEKTNKALNTLLEFLHKRNNENNNENNDNDNENIINTIKNKYYPTNYVICYRSAPAKHFGEMSGKIKWPCDENNPNFPSLMVHKNLQDRDFHLINIGDPLFIDLKGNIIPYNGSHGPNVYLIFINEGGYYYKSSGTGIGVAIKSKYNYHTGLLISDNEKNNDNNNKNKEEEANIITSAKENNNGSINKECEATTTTTTSTTYE